ncbi:hypothetical protein EYV94_04085 [Puteibacter caeruleilacunae]|nr:hypothetical protein EYV94_04085 [Puteibacter caeruleilacunae]
MNLKEIVLGSLHKEEGALIAHTIKDNPKQIRELIDIARLNHKKAWRAAWLLDNVNDLSPQFVRPLVPAIIELLTPTLPDGHKRHFLKIIALHPLPKDIPGDLINYCFDWLNDLTVPIAVRVNAMQFIFHATSRYPELKQELQLTIETHLEHGSAGFKSRGGKILKALI